MTDKSHEPAVNYYRIASSSLFPAVRARDPQGISRALATMDVEYERHRKHIDGAVVLAQSFTETQQQYAVAALKATAVQLGIVLLASLMAGLILILRVMRSLSHQLGGEPEYAHKVAHTVAAGDLSSVVRTHPKDSGSVLHAMGCMTEQLSAMVGSIRTDASELARAAASLNNGAEGVKRATQAQSEAASSTAAAVQQITVSISSVAQNCDEIKARSQSSLQETERASHSLGMLTADMRGVNGAVCEIEAAVTAFVQRANEISAMTQQVRDIADQTNLLALNASIEAARAGDQGRGFAVVADEVRKLAEKSASSASQIDTLTRAMAEQSAKVELAFTAGRKSLDSSLDHVKDATDLLDSAKTSVAHAVSGVEDIATSVSEQCTASNEIARSVEKIAQMAEHNRSVAESTSESAHQFLELSDGLLATVSRFKTAA